MTEGITIELIGVLGGIIIAIIGTVTAVRNEHNKLISELDKRQSVSDAKSTAQLEKFQAVIEEKFTGITDKLKNFDAITKMVYEHEKYIAVQQALEKKKEHEHE